MRSDGYSAPSVYSSTLPALGLPLKLIRCIFKNSRCARAHAYVQCMRAHTPNYTALHLAQSKKARAMPMESFLSFCIYVFWILFTGIYVYSQYAPTILSICTLCIVLAGVNSATQSSEQLDAGSAISFYVASLDLSQVKIFTIIYIWLIPLI